MDVHGLGEMGIPVANNGGANAIAVAEHTLALMIGLGKRTMHQWEKAGRQRAWRQGLDLTLTEVTNKTVGIVGLGRVGQQVAKRLTGFDTNTIYYDIVDIPEDVRQRLHAGPVEFDELLRESDIVSLHVPLTRRTRGMISDRELALMKPTAYLINACRGPVVDETGPAPRPRRRPDRRSRPRRTGAGTHSHRQPPLRLGQRPHHPPPSRHQRGDQPAGLRLRLRQHRPCPCR